MKNYLVFVGNDYYPLGGAEDFVAQVWFLEEAKMVFKAIITREADMDMWMNVWDIANKRMILKGKLTITYKNGEPAHAIHNVTYEVTLY